MKANAAPMSVADYCHDLNNKKIVVNDKYQRKEGLWSSQAKSFFIESILLEYPIPKIYLYANTDLKSRQTTKEIVDGQQRSQSLSAFFNNKLRLSIKLETEELRGLKYNQLPEQWQSRFLSYSLPIDQFTGVQEDEVREAFRRMNSSNVPLNDEEQRNARYQGPFKWFIISVAEQFSKILAAKGLFSSRDLVRMGDLKMYAEIVHTTENGFKTIKGKELDNLYKKHNSAYDDSTISAVLDTAMGEFLATPELHDPAFMKPFIFQSLILAIIAKQTGVDFSNGTLTKHADLQAALRAAPPEIEALAGALRDPEAHPALADFVLASTQKTNVDSSRAIRFLAFDAALRAAG